MLDRNNLTGGDIDTFISHQANLRIIDATAEKLGFDPERVSDPLAPENQMKTSGRGIFYIRTFMDEVGFSRGESGGTVLTMHKDLSKRGNAKGENE